MNTRGHYGNNGSSMQPWTYGPPVLGIEASTKRSLLRSGYLFLLMLGGAYLGSRATPKEPNKGAMVGLAVGWFATQVGRQADALESIADAAQARTS